MVYLLLLNVKKHQNMTTNIKNNSQLADYQQNKFSKS